MRKLFFLYLFAASKIRSLNFVVMNALAPIKKLFQPIDLTKGSIAKSLLVFMIPIALSNIFQLLYTFADAAIVGRNCTEPEIAGINAVASIAVMFTLFASGCASGFSVILSARIGAKDEAGIRKSFAHQLVLLAIISIALTATAIALIDPSLRWVGLKPEAGGDMLLEYEAAKTYLIIIYSGLASTIFYNMLLSVFRALGDSFTPFLILFGCVVINVMIDTTLVVTLKLGVAGAAWGTIIAQILAVIVAFAFAFKKFKVLRLGLKDFKIEWKESYNHLKMGLPLGFMFAISMLGFIFIQSTITAFDTTAAGTLVAGTPCQIGRSAANRVQDFLIAPMEALALAAMSFAGQNSGAHNQERLRKGFKVAAIMELIIWAIMSIIGLLLTINGAYIRIFLNPDIITEQTIYYGNTFLYTCIPFMWGAAGVYLGRCYLQGLQKPLWPFVGGMLELVFRISIPLILPRAVNGWVLNAEVANLELAYFFLCSANWVAWVVNGIFLMSIAYRALYPKNGKNGPEKIEPIEEAPPQVEEQAEQG